MTSLKDSLMMKLLLSSTKRLSLSKEIKVLSHVMRNADLKCTATHKPALMTIQDYVKDLLRETGSTLQALP